MRARTYLVKVSVTICSPTASATASVADVADVAVSSESTRIDLAAAAAGDSAMAAAEGRPRPNVAAWVRPATAEW